MKYIFCGLMYPNIEEDLRKMKTPPPVSGHKFQVNMLTGLIENKQDVYVLNIPKYRYFPHYKKIFVKCGEFTSVKYAHGRNLGYINLPILNYISQYYSLKRALKRYLKTCADEQVVLITFNYYLPRSAAMSYIKKKKENVHICMSVGDFHGKNGMQSSKRYHGIKGRILSTLEKRADELTASCDSFAFLTKYMASELGVEHKQHVVVEGMFTNTDASIDIESVNENEKIIFYAGAVELQYGITHLLDSFEMIKGEEFKLLIAGGGDAVETVKEYAARDGRIKYLGFITPKEVTFYQQKATVLINPRTSEHEYTKFSFPSKNMECLASGKPYIAHNLACNPEEYGTYIQYPEDESNNALAEKIIKVCYMTPEERNTIGKQAREFILREKNPQNQMKKIIRMNDQILRSNK